MSRLVRRIADKRVLKLIRAYLRGGILENGLVRIPKEGTPQGGPSSPFLSNAVLDAWGIRSWSGAVIDACAMVMTVTFTSTAVVHGERVKDSLTRFVTHRLKLKVITTKSAVDVPQNRQFLGFTFTGGRLTNRRKNAPESLRRFRARVRRLTRRNWNLRTGERVRRLKTYLTGWRGYFGYCESPSV